eukprot:TRINITY_DN98945_c0_g1_i1.p1 TRINITY_DN98945_c0_g1~~TRINITY_DN98945_c0_g1_i1.p1  ORF type:complete len:168 (-),score=33.17 TRINITY_DN98945_c0_g1_i1:155-658(-)
MPTRAQRKSGSAQRYHQYLIQQEKQRDEGLKKSKEKAKLRNERRAALVAEWKEKVARGELPPIDFSEKLPIVGVKRERDNDANAMAVDRQDAAPPSKRRRKQEGEQGPTETPPVLFTIGSAPEVPKKTKLYSKPSQHLRSAALTKKEKRMERHKRREKEKALNLLKL